MFAAEEVLKDCKLALEFLEEETDRRKFRLFWLAAVAGIRSIGHVLEKVDAAADSKLRSVTKDFYSRWKREREQNEIFWNFIEYERNNLLKEGESGAVPILHLVFTDNIAYECDFDIFVPMLRGSYIGEDCRDVLQLAINWWNAELDEIKRAHKTQL